MTRPNTIEDVLSRKSIDPVTGCWNYTGHLTPQGYGRANIEGKATLVHRLAYGQHNDLPDWIPSTRSAVCHKCHNPACFNPDHLYLGTAQDNGNDRRNRTDKPRKRITARMARLERRRQIRQYGRHNHTADGVASSRHKENQPN